VPVQSLSQAPQDRLGGISRDTLDDELMPRDAERNRRPILHNSSGLPDHGCRGGRKGWMALGIHDELVQGNREFDQEVAERTRQREPCGSSLILDNLVCRHGLIPNSRTTYAWTAPFVCIGQIVVIGQASLGVNGRSPFAKSQKLVMRVLIFYGELARSAYDSTMASLS